VPVIVVLELVATVALELLVLALKRLETSELLLLLMLLLVAMLASPDCTTSKVLDHPPSHSLILMIRCALQVLEG